MNSHQRIRLFCVGLAVGFFAGCLHLASPPVELHARAAIVLLIPLSAAAAYALYCCVMAWRLSRVTLLRRMATLLWASASLIALALWPASVTPDAAPLGTWCAVGSLVGAVAAGHV